jgi:hypothetical protein
MFGSVAAAPSGAFLPNGSESDNRKTRTSLTRLEPRRNLDTFSSFRLRLSRFASLRSDGYVLSRLAAGRADVAIDTMQNTDTPTSAERHRSTTTRRREVVAA